MSENQTTVPRSLAEHLATNSETGVAMNTLYVKVYNTCVSLQTENESLKKEIETLKKPQKKEPKK